MLSSDDEEEDPAPKAKGKKRLLKGKKTESEEEQEANLNAMMDSDDGQLSLVILSLYYVTNLCYPGCRSSNPRIATVYIYLRLSSSN